MTGESTPETSTAVLRDPEPPDRLAPPAVAEAPRPGPPPRAFAIAGIVVVAIVAVCCLGLAFRSGAYSPADWLPFLIGIAALACVVAVSGPAVRAGRVQRVLLALFALLAVWTVLSIFWATSRGDTWEEINRTLFYAVTVALVFAAVRWAGPLGLRVLTGLLVTVIGITALVVIVRLRTSADPAYLFPGGRLNYPISYYNGVGCFLMIGFWLALGLANAPGIRPARRPWSAPSLDRVPADPAAAPTTDRAEAVTTDAARWLAEQAAHARAAEAATARAAAGGGAKSRKGAGGSSRGQVSLSGLLLRVSQPVLLALAVVLLEIAILPQSRGALWTFLLVIPFFVIFSPNRFRALVDLAIVAVPLIFSWGSLNGVYSAVHNSTPLAPAISTALQAVSYSVLFVLVAWAVTYVVERLLGPLSGRIPSLVGGILIVLAIGGAIAGLVWADIHTGGLGTYVGDRWSEFKGDSGPGSTPSTDSGTRFAAFGLNGRLTQWKVAYKAFEGNPVTGIGAQNFEGYNYLHRTVAMDVRNPHSQPMQLLAELGIPGLALYLAFVLGVLVRALVVRFRRRGARGPRAPARADSAVLAAMITACLSWFIHSSADWMWQLAAVTLPAMMLFGGLLAAGGPGWAVATAGAGAGAGASAGPAPSDPADSEPARPAGRHTPAHAKRRGLWSPRATAWVAAVLAFAVILSAAFPYLSLRFSGMAAGSSDLALVDSRTSTAAKLDPTAMHPYATRASAYTIAALKQPEGSTQRADDLRLAATAWIDAVKHQPNIWLNNYMAAQTLLTARDAATAAGKTADAKLFGQWAQTYLDQAKTLNPLSPQVKTLQAKLNTVVAPATTAATTSP